MKKFTSFIRLSTSSSHCILLCTGVQTLTEDLDNFLKEWDLLNLTNIFLDTSFEFTFLLSLSQFECMRLSWFTLFPNHWFLKWIKLLAFLLQGFILSLLFYLCLNWGPCTHAIQHFPWVFLSRSFAATKCNSKSFGLTTSVDFLILWFTTIIC